MSQHASAALIDIKLLGLFEGSNGRSHLVLTGMGACRRHMSHSAGVDQQLGLGCQRKAHGTVLGAQGRSGGAGLLGGAREVDGLEIIREVPNLPKRTRQLFLPVFFPSLPLSLSV
jgi:hypothetical protein